MEERQMGGPNTTWLPSKQALVVNNWNSCWITLEIIHVLLLVFIKPMVYFSYVGNKCAKPLILISCFCKLVYLCVWIFLNVFFLMTFFFFFFFFQTMDLQSRSGFHTRQNASNNLWIYVAYHFVPWTLKGKKLPVTGQTLCLSQSSGPIRFATTSLSRN